MVLLADQVDIMAIKCDKQGGKRAPNKQPSRLLHDRRPLKSVHLAPPDFHIQPHLLVDSYLEKEVRYLGIVSHIAADLDATNRTDVLRYIDRGKREDRVCNDPTWEQDAIFSLSINNVKISRRDGKEEIHIRLPIHKIGAVCYIRDDDQHILCIKFGDFSFSSETLSDFRNEMCQLAVLACDSKRSAEELCSLMNQTFQLVYTDATIQFLDTKLCEAAAGMSLDTSTIRSERSAPSTPGMKRMTKSTGDLAFMSYSSLNLQEENGSSSMTPRRCSTTAPSDSDVSNNAQDQLNEYVFKKLYHKLNPDELKIFAGLLHRWKVNKSLPEFCEKVLDLYGPPRKHLLIDMRPFIPDSDRPYFEAFLERVGLSPHPSWHTLTNEPTMYAPFRNLDSSTTLHHPGSGGSREDLIGSQTSLAVDPSALSRTNNRPQFEHLGGSRTSFTTDSIVHKNT